MQLNGIKYSYPIRIIFETGIFELLWWDYVIGASIPGQKELEINGNEGVLHTPRISRTGVWQSDAVKHLTQDTPNLESFLPLHRIYSQCILSPAFKAD